MPDRKTTKPVSASAQAASQRHAARDAAHSPAEMKSAIVKRSIELHGHKTSVSLEDEFWSSLRTIAITKDMSLPALLETIDAARAGANLSSAIRVYVLTHYCERVAAQHAQSSPEPALPLS